MKSLFKKMGALLMLGIMVAGAIPAVGSAEEESDIPAVIYAAAESAGDGIKVYVRNQDDDVERYDIAGIKCRKPKIAMMTDEDEPEMHTLLLVSGQKTIRQDEQERIRAVLTGFIDQAEDTKDQSDFKGEAFQIATYGKHIKYKTDGFSKDYDDLRDEIEDLSFKKKKTSMRNALSEAVDDLEMEHYYGFVRIIMVSDGTNKKPQEDAQTLENKLKDTGYPVHTLGCKNEKNNNKKKLKRFYEYSDISDGLSFGLEDKEPEKIIKKIEKDYDLTVYNGIVPVEAKTGQLTENRFSFEDGSTLTFSVKMPSGGGPQAVDNTMVIAICVGAGVLILLLVIVLVVRAKKRKAGEELDDKFYYGTNAGAFVTNEPKPFVPAAPPVAYMPQQPPQPVPQPPQPAPQLLQTPPPAVLPSAPAGGEEETMMIPAEESTMLFDAPKTNTAPRTFTLTLTDRANPQNAFRKTFTGEQVVGRSQSADIVIGYDRSVSGRHCRIYEKNRMLYAEDLGSSNGTSLNGKPVTEPVPIVTGDQLTLGRTEFSVTIEAGN